MAYVGIDPGLGGYIVVLNKEGKLDRRIKTPTLIVKKKTVLDADKMLEILKTIPSNAICCIERQHPMSKQGLASTGKTMYGYGLWVGLLKGVGIKTEIVGAKEWQKVYLDKEIEDSKAASVASVQKWDSALSLLRTPKCKVPDHNLSDAVCIARFAYDKFKPKENLY